MRRLFVFGERRGSPDLADAGKSEADRDEPPLDDGIGTQLESHDAGVCSVTAQPKRCYCGASALAMVSGCDGRNNC